MSIQFSLLVLPTNTMQNKQNERNKKMNEWKKTLIKRKPQATCNMQFVVAGN